MPDDSSSEMPELEFTLDEAFIRMDDAVAETIAGLPDFPGFHERTTLKFECPDPDRESYEINYTLPESTIGSELVTEDYFAVLKEYWPSLGWEVHGEREYPDGAMKGIEAIRPDGVNVWYSNMLGQIVIHAQVACVSPGGGPVECGPPLGGVLPEDDRASHCTVVEPEESEDASADAAAPFEDGQAVVRPFGVPVREPEAIPVPASYDEHL
ncbi:hypothetical protein SAMN05216298_3763 [Glycomyces sambucus]|uniref:Uncharacterized protein n=1 Tax=Glycomyces sambucus TaxID=380244 RepID=A0A1G9JN44_9ACTN|nr:hypothetical protein [Glycomyces sambucus]SDL39017.1 hypothetical protein SAMN05216298_3763 [Glycomyces sambucus]